MAIDTVEDATHELYTAVQEYIADMGEEACADTDAMMSDMFASMCGDWPTQVAAEVARFELGWVPTDAPTEVMDMYNQMYPNDGMDW